MRRSVYCHQGERAPGEYVGADFVGRAGSVHRSTDYGDSWVEINHDIIQTDVRALAINSAGEIFAVTAGCGDGVYRSTDNGDSWTLANTGLTPTDIAGLGINNNSHLFGATRSIVGEGDGMFRSTDNAIRGQNRTTALRHSTLTR
jgi:photosystem II stability/assembly factor-like uncharacterized protein